MDPFFQRSLTQFDAVLHIVAFFMYVNDISKHAHTFRRSVDACRCSLNRFNRLNRLGFFAHARFYTC